MSMITLSVLFAWGCRGRKLESRNQKLEIGKQGEWPAVGDNAKLIKRKRLSERQCHPCNRQGWTTPRVSGEFIRESCGRRSAARQGRRSTGPRPRCIDGP